jgi:AcrR family transcriptional regulator
MKKTKPRASRLPAEERRQQIIDAARDVFVRYGLAGARTRQIADIVGVNEALLYHYFDSKEEVFEAAVLEPLQKMMSDMFAVARRIPTEPIPDRVEEVRLGVLHMARTMKEIVPLLGMVLFSDQEVGKRFYRERLYPLLFETYEVGSGATAGWAQHPLSPSAMTAVFGMLFAVAMDQCFREVEVDEEQLAQELADLILDGLSVARPAEALSPRRSTGGPRKRPRSVG